MLYLSSNQTRSVNNNQIAAIQYDKCLLLINLSPNPPYLIVYIYPWSCLSMFPYFSSMFSGVWWLEGRRPFLDKMAAWAWACAIWADVGDPRGRNGLKPGGRSRWEGGGGNGIDWRELLIWKKGSWFGIEEKVVMGVIRFGGRPGLSR